MTRLYRGQKNGYFFYAGRKDTIKACIYVKELVRFFKYRMLDHSFHGAEIYNCTYEPAYTIEEICNAMQKATGLHRHVPLGARRTAAVCGGHSGSPIGAKRLGIHPPCPEADGVHQCLRQEAGRHRLQVPLYAGGELPGLVRGLRPQGAGMTMEQDARPIRVAQMMTDMNYGGVEMVVMNYYRHMDRSRVQFDFLRWKARLCPSGKRSTAGPPGVVVPKYTHLPQYEREIGRLFRQNGYQIVHSHMNTLSVLSLWGAKRAWGAQPDRA